MKRIPFLAIALVLVLPATDGLADQNKSEIFGFGRKRNQISNALFPGGTATGTGPAASEAPVVERDSDTIFRGGKPKKVKSAAYVIKDGEKIEQPIPEPKAKPSLLSKFKKGSEEPTPLMTATNASVEEEKKPIKLLPTIPLKKEKKEEVVAAAPIAPEVRAEEPTEAEAPAFTAAPMTPAEEEKKSGGLFSFFSREKKKEEPATITPIPVATAEEEPPTLAAAPVASSSTDIPDAPGYEERAPAKPKPEPAASPASATEPTENTSPPEVPLFVESTPEVEKKEKREKKELSLPNPIAAFKPDPKPINMEGAETIIENGEIVTKQEDIVESNIVKTGDGKKEPPRIVDGVKTYNSWEDVEGRNVSAADKILSQMRQR